MDNLKRMYYILTLSLFIIMPVVTSCTRSTGDNTIVSDSTSGGGITNHDQQSQTTERTTGSGELHVGRSFSATGGTSGNLTHTVSGIIPFTIQYNQEKGVYEIKGSYNKEGGNQATNAQITFESNECYCVANWFAELNVFGTLIPADGLIADGPGGGCYMTIYIKEIWEMYAAECNCDIGQAMMTMEPEQVDFGPLKLDLVNGAQTAELQSYGNTQWEYRWIVQNLNVPLETGCVVGETIESNK